MKKLHPFTWAILLFGSVVLSTVSAFNSLYAFGDGACTTTDNQNTGSLYYGNRYSNGRIWIEVLAQRQGLTYDSSKNKSFFGNYSSVLVTNIGNLPSDATNALAVVWVCDADFVGFLGDPALGPPYTSAGLPQWTNHINQSLANHLNIITNLYAKNVRTLIMPNAVDLMEIPQYNTSATADRAFVRQRIVAYNIAFTNTLNQAKALCPGLQIYVPDIFSLLDNVLTNSAYYGFTNILGDGFLIAAIDAINYGFPSAATNGFGTNFIFWDYLDPTAKMHEVIADSVQQLISPVWISQITALNGSNRLDIVNTPVGLNGFVETLPDLTQTNWTSGSSLTSTNVNQPVFVPTAGSQQFYRLRFPHAWSWP